VDGRRGEGRWWGVWEGWGWGGGSWGGGRDGLQQSSWDVEDKWVTDC
jgi:hypothetical protein